MPHHEPVRRSPSPVGRASGSGRAPELARDRVVNWAVACACASLGFVVVGARWLVLTPLLPCRCGGWLCSGAVSKQIENEGPRDAQCADATRFQQVHHAPTRRRCTACPTPAHSARTLRWLARRTLHPGAWSRPDGLKHGRRSSLRRAVWCACWATVPSPRSVRWLGTVG